MSVPIACSLVAGSLLGEPSEQPPKIEQAALVLKELSAQLGSGRRTAQDVLLDPTFFGLRDSEDFRSLLRNHATAQRLLLAGPNEPGDRLVVSGTLRNLRGEPVAGALIYVYQTDADGWYSQGEGLTPPGPSRAARLFGYLRSDTRGWYEFETVRPGLYPDRGPPAHIHFEITARGYQPIKTDLMFSDGQRMQIPRVRRIAESNGFTVADVQRDSAGVQRCEFHGTLSDEAPSSVEE